MDENSVPFVPGWHIAVFGSSVIAENFRCIAGGVCPNEAIQGVRDRVGSEVGIVLLSEEPATTIGFGKVRLGEMFEYRSV